MEIPQGQKQFNCEHCNAAILVPIDLPPTSAPCPVCQQITTSPALEQQAVSPVPASPVSDERPRDQKNHDPESESKGGLGLLWGLAALVFLGLLLGGFFLFKKFRVDDSAKKVAPVLDQQAPVRDEVAPTTESVEGEALDVLNKFLTAKTLEEKAKFVIGKDGKIPAMKEFYGNGKLEEEALRADFFSEWAMDLSDTERGIHLLEFDRPKQFKLSELFSPITDLKTRLILQEPDLQTRFRAYRPNFEMEAVRAQVYLKRIEGELLIDWDTYVQTKDRLFRNFVNYPVAGRRGTFRVVIDEHISTVYEDDPSVRNFRLLDPAHYMEDYAVVTVSRNSEVGKLVEKLAWTDKVDKVANKVNIGATVVLEWSNDADPVLMISELICWEFLGVGGDPSNLTTK